MNRLTQDNYLKKAERFFETFDLPEDKRTPTNISAALQRAARDKEDKHRADGDIKDKKVIQNIKQYGYAKSSWQQLKTALRYYCKYYGDDNSVRAIENTMLDVKPALFHKPTKKIKKISEQQIVDLATALHQQAMLYSKHPANWSQLNDGAKAAITNKKNNHINTILGLLSLINILSITGCRPIEIATMQCRDRQSVFILGAKKSTSMNNGQDGNEDSERGADRVLQFSAADYEKLNEALATLRQIAWLPEHKVSANQQTDVAVGTDYQPLNLTDDQLALFQSYLNLSRKRLARLSVKVLGLKKGICLYTFRHQLSSDLKGESDHYTRQQMAYILGHLATKSLDAYGHKKSANTKRKIGIADQKALNKVRITHTTVEFDHEGKVDQSSRRLGQPSIKDNVSLRPSQISA
jgi:integrase